MPPFTAYPKKLFVFLRAATLIEGYDLMVISQILQVIQRSMSLDETALER